MVAYEANRADAIETVIEADPVATAVRALMVRQLTWTGTATELSSALLLAQPADTLGMRTWPGSARVLSIRLRRAAPSLRRVGIQLEFNREGHRRDRKITMKVSAQPSPASASTAVAEITRAANGLAY
jgi:hypothetical protein